MVPDIGVDREPDGCIEAWAYRLARSPDPAPVVANAVIGACYGVFDKFLDGAKNPNVPGHITELRDEYMPDWQRSALFRVVQARAGHCETAKVEK